MRLRPVFIYSFGENKEWNSTDTLVCWIDVLGKRNVQVGNFLKNINRADPNRAVRGDFFLKINKRAGQIPMQMQENKRAGGFFLKNNKRAGQNKAVQVGFSSQN